MSIKKIFFVSGLSTPFIALAIFVIYLIFQTNFFVSANGFVFEYNGYFQCLAFKSIGWGFFYFLGLHFLLKIIAKKLKKKIRLNNLSKGTSYLIWFFLFMCYCGGVFMIINASIPCARPDYTSNINFIAKFCSILSFIVSSLSYFAINDIYHMYLLRFKSMSSTQLRMLTDQARLIKRLTFISMILTGWMILPVLYFFFVYYRLKKKIA